MKTIFLSFDVEEFDLPLEYGENISPDELFSISKNGLDEIITLLSKMNIKATFFTTARFAKKYPSLIKKISLTHEIASHGFSHDPKDKNKIAESKKILENIISKKINGFRSPRLSEVNFKELNNLRFKYDSSINPTWIPSRYQKFSENPNINKIENLIEFPISTLPFFRFPLFWLTFKNTSFFIYNFLSRIVISQRGNLNLYFHPWEFSNIKKFKIPFLIKNNSGKRLLKNVENFILWGKKNNFKFMTFSEYLELE